MSRLSIDDTIAAIASPPGPGLRGIVRISGPAVEHCLTELLQPSTPLKTIKSATSLTGKLHLDGIRELDCHVLYWPNARSYTRQPSAEIHMTGSRPLLEWTLEQLTKNSNVRLATPGEFTLRAFLSGRIDLTQAEAVLGVIDATGSHDLQTALTQLAGGLSGPLTETRNELLHLLAELEAGLDFSEEDIEFISTEALTTRLDSCQHSLQQVSNQVSGREVSQTHLSAVLVGWPNTGKSSLFNYLVSGQAIVSDQAGTTRDYLTALLETDTLCIELSDTAGLEINDQLSAIESAAQQATHKKTKNADIRILCIDGSRPINAWEHQQLKRASHYHIIVRTKSDQEHTSAAEHRVDVVTSSTRGTGMAILKSKIASVAESLQSSESAVVSTTAARVKNSLTLASQSIQRAQQACQSKMGEELVAAELRSGLDHLGQVVGTIYTDDILDVVFGKFCIGK